MNVSGRQSLQYMHVTASYTDYLSTLLLLEVLGCVLGNRRIMLVLFGLTTSDVFPGF